MGNTAAQSRVAEQGQGNAAGVSSKGTAAQQRGPGDGVEDFVDVRKEVRSSQRLTTTFPRCQQLIVLEAHSCPPSPFPLTHTQIRVWGCPDCKGKEFIVVAGRPSCTHCLKPH